MYIIVHPFKGPFTSIDLNLIDLIVHDHEEDRTGFVSVAKQQVFVHLVVRIFTKPPKQLQIHLNDMGYFWILYIHSISHENPTPIISHYTWWLYHISYIPLKSCYISWSSRSKLEFLGNPLRHRIQLPHLHLLREAAHGDDFGIQDRFPRWQFLET